MAAGRTPARPIPRRSAAGRPGRRRGTRGAPGTASAFLQGGVPMSLAQSVALHSRHAAAPPAPGEADGAPAATSLRATLAAGPGSRGEGAAGLSWLGAGGEAPAAAWLVSATSARPAGGAGYAAAKASTAKAPAGPRITGEWSFLSDPSLSVEEKLARFMIAAQKDDGGGIFGSILKALFPPLAIADAIFGDLDGFLNDALKALGGPLLA